MVLEYIQKSWEVYKENAMSFILAELIILIVAGIIALIGIGIIFGSVGISTLMKMTSSQNMLSRMASVVPLLVNLSVASIFFIITGLVWTFLKTGIYGMAAQALRGKTKVETMFNVAKNKGLTGILACVIVGILALLMFSILVVGLGIIFPLSGVIIGMIIFGLLMMLFSLIFPGVILDNLNAINSIKVSVSIVKKNYIEMLSLLLVYLVLSIVIIFIPILGPLIVNFVVSPMLYISLLIFYKKRK